MNLFDIDTPRHIILQGKNQITEGKYVKYGDNDDYPSIIASLIENSQTAKSSARILSQFIASGFVEEGIGKTEVGKTFTGRSYTLNKMVSEIASSISKFGGAYVLTRKNAQNQVVDCKVLKFEDCRFSYFDDNRFSNFVYYGDFSNTIKDTKKKNSKKFAVFTDKREIFNVQSEATKTTSQIYYIFSEDTYIYPLSPFDAVIYDMNSEYQIQLNRQQELTQGMPSKVLIKIDKPTDENEARKMESYLSDWIGTSATRAAVIPARYNPDGTLSDTKIIETIPDSRTADSFINAEKSTANNIRKSCLGLPAVLIDYESGNLSNNSGEQIKTAYDYYARNTRDLRVLVTESLNEIFQDTTIQFVNKNFELKTPTLE